MTEKCTHPLSKVFRCDRCGAVCCRCGHGHTQELDDRYKDSPLEHRDIYQETSRLRAEHSGLPGDELLESLLSGERSPCSVWEEYIDKWAAEVDRCIKAGEVPPQFIPAQMERDPQKLKLNRMARRYGTPEEEPPTDD